MPADSRFRYAMNTSTIRGFELGVDEEIDLLSDAGFDGVELWIRELETHVAAGGTLADVRSRLRDRDLAAPGVVAFFHWADPDPAVRADALEDARRQMAMAAEIGAATIAAPPFGNCADVTLGAFAEYFAELHAAGRSLGVLPTLELWGHAARLSTLAEVLYVSAASNVPTPLTLLDVYHLHKGGNGIESVRLVNGDAISIFHINDYPAEPGRADIVDADRVYPGDGCAPLTHLRRVLDDIGYTGMLSLELFNPGYWRGDPGDAVTRGLAKAKAAFERSPADL